MNIFANKFTTRFLGLVILFVGFFSITIFVSFASAANYPTPNNGATIFVAEDNFFVSPAKIARENVVSGASQAVLDSGGTRSQALEAARQAEIALGNGTLNIKADPSLGLTEAKLQFEGKVVANGKDKITQKLKDFTARAAEDAAKNAQPPKQQDEKICIVPRPGQSPEFGVVTDEPHTYQPWGEVQDLGPVPFPPEDIMNFQLRKLGSGTMEEELARAEKQAVEGGTKKVIKPNKTQAQEFITSMKGNKLALGSYKINGTDVPVGKYRANQPDESTGITFDENCENPKKTGPAPDPGKNPGGAAPGFGGLGGNPGGGGNGGGGGFGGGGGGLGGGAGGALGQLLPLLMQGLMGGGKGQQGQGQGQNRYGAGYGNQLQSCDAQAVAPVCGMDGKTHKNSCYLNQQGVILRNTGVCTTANPSTIPSIDNLVTLTQLAQSGIPATLIENVRNLVTSILSSILAGAKPTETTVR